MAQPCRLTVADVLGLLTRNEAVSRVTLNMVPSENAQSPLARLPFLLDVYNRYFFNETLEPDRWGFRGAELVGELERTLTVALLSELGVAHHVNLRPLSGLSSMTLVLAGLGGPPGSRILTISEHNGGHYATAQVARRLGLEVQYLDGPDPHTIDYGRVSEVVASIQPSLIYVDQANCLFPLDVGRLAESARAGNKETLIHVDVSHWFGLILGKAFANPLDEGADSYGGSTHKTFPGPQKAVFLTRRRDLTERIHEAAEYLISSHHFGAVLSLGLALLEFRDNGGAEYARGVIENTQRLGSELYEHGIPVVAAERGFSAGHQLWIDSAAIGIPAPVASKRLSLAGIRVNYMPTLPGLDRPAIRIGLNEATLRGLRPEDMPQLAEVFAGSILRDEPANKLRDRTARLLQIQPAADQYGSIDQQLADAAVRLCSAVLRGHRVDESGRNTSASASPSVE